MVGVKRKNQRKYAVFSRKKKKYNHINNFNSVREENIVERGADNFEPESVLDEVIYVDLDDVGANETIYDDRNTDHFNPNTISEDNLLVIFDESSHDRIECCDSTLDESDNNLNGGRFERVQENRYAHGCDDCHSDENFEREDESSLGSKYFENCNNETSQRIDDGFYESVYGSEDLDLTGSNFGDHETDWNFDDIERGEQSESNISNEYIRALGESKILGNRIVSICSFLDDIRKLNSHSVNDDCNFNDMILKDETKFGYRSNLYYECSKCGYVDVVRTSCVNQEINYAAAMATMSIGSSYSHLEEFSSVLNIPPMTKETYFKKELQIEKDVQIALNENMKNVAAEEIDHAKEMGHVDENGNPLLKCYCDCAWCKRSYRTSYSALSGAASIIGHHTKKVLWIGIANKECRICNKHKKKGMPTPDHKCNCNYVGPSTGMEPKLLRDGFEECLSKYNIRFSHLIGDGDSSVISDLNNANIYNDPIMRTEKLECVHHLRRNLRGTLRTLASSNASYSKILTEQVIERIIKDVQCARKHWDNAIEPWTEKIAGLRKDICNIPSHVFGDHMQCAQYFCKGPKENEANMVPYLQSIGLFQKVMDCLSRSRLNAKSILTNEHTNVVEQLNSLFVKYNGGKRIHFASSNSYGTRAKMGALQHNTGRLHSTINQATGRDTNILIKNMEDGRLEKNLKKVMGAKSYKIRSKNQSGADEFYGSHTRRGPDMDTNEFNLEKEKYLQDLESRCRRRISIERDTTGQHDCEKWKNYRYGMVTASIFGRICSSRSPASYTGIVDTILYSKIEHLKQIQHGNLYESNALRALEKAKGIVIEKNGLFIDEELPFFGATPDGLIGDNAIAEVKCPYSIFGKNIDEAILAGECTVWSIERKNKKKPNHSPKIIGINKKHKWYFQVQGQLHITNRDLCYFAVWTGDDIPIRVETIYRDDDFWRTKMLGKLTDFFYTAFLPEKVDSRRRRSMPLRCYDTKGNTVS